MKWLRLPLVLVAITLFCLPLIAGGKDDEPESALSFLVLKDDGGRSCRTGGK